MKANSHRVIGGYLTTVLVRMAVAPLDIPVQGALYFTVMTGEDRTRVELLQGTLDLIVLRALSTMGPQHAYGLAARLDQLADHPFPLNQGTLYVALVRLEQKGWIKGAWQTTEAGREAKYYSITRSGARALGQQTERWHRLAGFVNKLLLHEP
jgi:PadR family transcriptional regulator